MDRLLRVGADWLSDSITNITDSIVHIKPSEFNEAHRYLPRSVTSLPGPISFKVNPYMVEILDCFDVDSPVREVNLKKGVQITYTTSFIECAMLYFMAHVRTLPMMYATADDGLASGRMETSIIPMINQSGLDIIQSGDVGNKRKTGITKDLIQFRGGGFIIPRGAQNAANFRQWSIAVMFKDEIDTWPDKAGKEGDLDALSDDRCSGFWEFRKIGRGSTPLLKGTSKIQKQYLRGDQRKFLVRCRSCGFPQQLRWSGTIEDTGMVYGMHWDYDDGGILNIESVRYLCKNCNRAHYEHNKKKLFSLDEGAHWNPTAKPVMPEIRSYHLPAMYSPIGMQPWYKSVALYLEAYDPLNKVVKDFNKYQVFYNNVLAEPFEIKGSKVSFVAASAHRRLEYKYGEVPHDYATKYSKGPIRLVTCQVDVHKRFISVAVIGWTVGMCSYLIDYWRFTDDSEVGCEASESPVWAELTKVIEDLKYAGGEHVNMTLIDAGWAYDTVVGFCSDYESGVYPIVGRTRTASGSKLKEFTEFKTQLGTIGYTITVDYYKDRISSVLRRNWSEEAGEQRKYHFNAPVDISNKSLIELTVEFRAEKTDDRGRVSFVWHRPDGVRQELWDLLVYGHAALEIYAWEICTIRDGKDDVDWDYFWANIP